MTRRVGPRPALVLAAALLVAGCADYVGDDLRSGEAQLRPGPSVEIEAASTTTTIPAEPVDPSTLDVGTCADDVAEAGEGDDEPRQPATVDQLLAGAPVVPRSCAGEHRYEVFVREALAAPDAPWPGDAALDEDADRLCAARFEAYVGRPWSDTSLDYLPLVPDEAGWAAGDRQVTCVLFDLGLAPLEGSRAAG